MRIRLASGQGLWFSLTAHAFVLLALLGAWKATGVVVATKRLPGTALGTKQMLVFSMGGAPPQAKTVLQAKRKPVESTVPRPHLATTPKPTVSAADHASPGAGTSGESALGDGNISLALVKFHPRPAPDLSSLSHGTAGDVVLDATVDAQGKVAGLKVSKGFGGTIDQEVIATVQQWTFSPATKDGVPVASEIEILFHYERS